MVAAIGSFMRTVPFIGRIGQQVAKSGATQVAAKTVTEAASNVAQVVPKQGLLGGLKNFAGFMAAQQVLGWLTAPFGFAGQAVGFLLTTMMWGCPQKLMPQFAKLGANAGFGAKASEFMNSWAGQLAMWVVPSWLLGKMFGGGDKAQAQGKSQGGQASISQATSQAAATQATQAGGQALTQEQILANGQTMLNSARGLLQDTMLTPQQLMAQSIPQGGYYPQVAYPQAMRMPQTYA